MSTYRAAGGLVAGALCVAAGAVIAAATGSFAALGVRAEEPVVGILVASTRISDPAPRARIVAPTEVVPAREALREVDLPRVDLASRVPAGWLTNLSDTLPLKPARQRRLMPRECRTNGGYIRHCQGERLIAEPSDEARERAERLGLGLRATAQWLRHNRPFPEWLGAVESLSGGRLTFPVADGYLGRGFGYTRDAGLRHRRHLGVDIGAAEGAPILAANDGLVAYSDNGIVGYGNIVIVIHRDGFTTLYAHCRRTLVAAGEYVERGQPIAEVGHTGFANAAHLHFEWRDRGWPRDPRRHFLPQTRDVM